MAAAQQVFQRGDREMRLADARRAHEQHAFVGAARKIAHEALHAEFGLLQRLRVMSGPGLAVGEIGDEAFEIAMLVTLGDSRALHHPRGAIFRAAVAGGCHQAGAVRARHHLPSGAAAERAIL